MTSLKDKTLRYTYLIHGYNNQLHESLQSLIYNPLYIGIPPLINHLCLLYLGDIMEYFVHVNDAKNQCITINNTLRTVTQQKYYLSSYANVYGSVLINNKYRCQYEWRIKILSRPYGGHMLFAVTSRNDKPFLSETHFLRHWEITRDRNNGHYYGYDTLGRCHSPYNNCPYHIMYNFDAMKALNDGDIITIRLNVKNPSNSIEFVKNVDLMAVIKITDFADDIQYCFAVCMNGTYGQSIKLLNFTNSL